jgi:hypothetical protein
MHLPIWNHFPKIITCCIPSVFSFRPKALAEKFHRAAGRHWGLARTLAEQLSGKDTAQRAERWVARWRSLCRLVCVYHFSRCLKQHMYIDIYIYIYLYTHSYIHIIDTVWCKEHRIMYNWSLDVPLGVIPWGGLKNTLRTLENVNLHFQGPCVSYIKVCPPRRWQGSDMCVYI